ncbi:MAG: hypothetical protein ACHQZQ_03800 [SAR324 cluster bacterium]
MSLDSVFYHADCPDGFGAALAAWKKLGSAAHYEPVLYGHPPVKVDPGTTVYLLDFSFDRAVLEEIAATARSVIVLDHHMTAAEGLSHLPPPADFGAAGPRLSAMFDMHKSGAVLAWEYFHSTQVPPLVNYIQDRDLWQWKLPNSREVAAGLRRIPRTFAEWDKYLNRTDELCKIGIPIVAYERVWIDRLAADARPMVVGGEPAIAVNTPILISEVCDRLLELHPDIAISCCYHDTRRATRVYSLRSRQGSATDVAAIARRFGGGGHKHAAGFTVPG